MPMAYTLIPKIPSRYTLLDVHLLSSLAPERSERFITTIFPIYPAPVAHDHLFGICSYDKAGVVTHNEYLSFFLIRLV